MLERTSGRWSDMGVNVGVNVYLEQYCESHKALGL